MNYAKPEINRIDNVHIGSTHIQQTANKEWYISFIDNLL